MATQVAAVSVGGGALSAVIGRVTNVSLGGGIATGAVPWGSAVRIRKEIPWLPRPDVPLVKPGTSQIDPTWYRCMKWLFEEKLGGITAPTVTQISASVSQTQEQAVATAAYAESAVNYAAGVAATAQAVVQVTQDNGLSGATTIPPVPERPQRPGNESV